MSVDDKVVTFSDRAAPMERAGGSGSAPGGLEVGESLRAVLHIDANDSVIALMGVPPDTLACSRVARLAIGR